MLESLLGKMSSQSKMCWAGSDPQIRTSPWEDRGKDLIMGRQRLLWDLSEDIIGKNKTPFAFKQSCLKRFRLKI